MSDYMRIAEAPHWVMQYPTCSACDVDLDVTYDEGWWCPSCGTTWPADADNGTTGTLPTPAECSGPEVQNRDAWRFTNPDLPADERADHINQFYERKTS